MPTALQTPLTPYVSPERVSACEWVRGGVSGLGRGRGVCGVRECVYLCVCEREYVCVFV